MKVGTNVKEDVKRIEAVRERVGNDIAISVDVNQGWKNKRKHINSTSFIRTFKH